MMDSKTPPRVLPKLRFPEFDEEPGWECPPLKKLAKRVTKRNTEGKDLRPLTNSAEHGVVDQREFFDKDIATTTGNYFVVELGDYVYNPRVSATAPVGPISRNGVCTGVMSPLYTVFRFRTDTSDYFAHYFKSSHWHQYLRRISNSGARHDRMAITNDDFMGMPVPTPSPNEQKKIADCLGSLDDLIAAEGRKLEALRRHKQGLMQQLFPQPGKTVPQLRFPEFRQASNWIQHVLGDLGSISSGSTPSRSQSAFFEGGTIPWVKTTDLNNSIIQTTEENITELAPAKINPAGSVLIAMYGGFKQIGRTGLLAMPAATNQALSVLVCDNMLILPDFVLAYMNAKVDEWKRIASSSRKDPNITGADVASFPIQLPEVTEQRCIADCFMTLDRVFTAQSEKIESLVQHKKGLLQKLFPCAEVLV